MVMLKQSSTQKPLNLELCCHGVIICILLALIGSSKRQLMAGFREQRPEVGRSYAHIGSMAAPYSRT